ncbi:GntR family transcriptional regulator [Variovorax sp. J22P240]|uniref:GntR family transcriptional regulator n=1 Tax=unclassified Variovorax TaxID=663243 RepID=UPI0025759EF4|nr:MULTISPECIES: GntR family transcriptional regulator [unclassified Variovorax]MDM0001768.1 GntR family transcriptional regulator [Variovorax sp. J22P240]MDM0047886.1 GntR family transcriptional regulator [Variovorax sp. J22R115]
MTLAGSDILSEASERISHSSLSSKVYEFMRSALANGELLPGQKLSARTLIDRLGVSQTPVREAMLQLVAERALAMNRNKSVTVPILTPETYIELRDIRVALEGLACRCAVDHVTEPDLKAIEKLHRQMMVAKRGGDYRTTLRLNREVHLRIYALSQRSELLALIESLWVRTGPYLNLIYKGTDQKVPVSHEHERLFAALRARDPDEAAAAIARDIVKGGAPIVEALQAQARKG